MADETSRSLRSALREEASLQIEVMSDDKRNVPFAEVNEGAEAIASIRAMPVAFEASII